MTKLLQNKSIIKFLGIALSVLLIVALIPQISIAYGSKDDVVSEDNPVVETDAGEDTTLADTGEESTTEGEQPADEAQPAEGDEPENAPAPQADEPVVAAVSEETPKPAKAARAADTVTLKENTDHTIKKGDDVTNSSALEYTSGTHTLTVNGTLRSDIKVSGGAKLTIKGTGTIIGTGNGSVILVEGKNDGTKLTFGSSAGGPTVQGGTGTEFSRSKWGKVGGGILVCRAEEWGWNTRAASLEFVKGTVQNNEADAGAGIFIDYECGFTMKGGSILSNTANTHEGGGIFTNGAWSSDFKAKYGQIVGGTIEGNKTKTTTDWGGGGIYVNNDGKLRIDSALITENTANSLGGGVAGCPHAKIGIGEMTNGAAVFGNIVNGGPSPINAVLMFNMPGSLTGTGNAPSGDFLVKGLSEDYLKEVGQTGKMTYKTSSATYTLNKGDYAKNLFDPQLASDYYCTLGSFISATNLKSHSTNEDGKAVAWEGFTASVPKEKVKSNTVSEKDSKGNPNWTAQKISILVGEPYAVYDATLCLKSTAANDNSGIERKVVIKKNYSGTHGGGVSCNGVLEFGSYPEKKEVVNPYAISLTKELISGVSKEALKFNKDDCFEFTLTDNATGKTYTTTSNTKGEINFTNLPGGKKSTTASFTLKENLTSEQKEAGYVSSVPSEGYKIEVPLTVKEETVTMDKNEPKIELKTYTTTPGEIIINGNKSKTVTNTLTPKAAADLGVVKIANGIGEGTFTFNLKEVTANSTIDEQNGVVTLKQNISLAELAAQSPDQVLSLDLGDSKREVANASNIFNISYEPKEAQETYWYAIAEERGNAEDVSYDETAYLVKVELKLAEDGHSFTTEKTIWKTKPGTRELEKVDTAGAVFENVAMQYEGFGIGLTKQILTTLGAPLQLGSRTFNFALYDGETEVATGSNDAEGKVSLTVSSPDCNYTKEAYVAEGNTKEFTFTLKETVPEGAADEFMATIPDATVKVTLKAAGARTDNNGRKVFLVTPTVETVTVEDVDVTAETDKTIKVTNRYTPHGEWTFTADKFFYGEKPTGCSFTMVELVAAPAADQPLKDIAVKEGKFWDAEVVATAFNDGKAAITFPAIPYKVEGEGGAKVDDRGDHFYLITEDGDASAKDTTAYVVKVNVAVDKDDPGKLVTTETILGYADDVSQPLQALTDVDERPAFYNTDTFGLISAANYSVYAASGEPVDQVCYVDPKIYKNLEGRAIKSGEFAFKLIEVANYDDTEGTVISATTNDEFGMVDFDKANNVSGDLENPSCLAYTKPGTYYYRVIEDTSKGGMNDQSVLYSDQVITFTTVIEQNEQTGQLECTDMYYGYWDKAAGKNVRFDEQYVDYDTTPANIGDMAKLNPDWHPTITNKTRPMDLQVRKTSVTDRNEGLVGATYALYMVNENAQGDIKLAEATSEEGGWITYKNVSLSTNNLYYFKETAAPAGHTVSEFRSSYFSLVEDAESANGYALKYTDSKFLPETGAEASQPEAQTLALTDETVEAQAKNAPAGEAATEPAAEATDDQTQPGHSADGNILLTYDKDGGVADEATELSVSKLDTRTHEWVEGADLVILEKDSGKEIVSWTSGKAPQKLEKTLNVGTTYLLREVKAPDNYKLANDVEFVIDSYGNVSVTKGTENGNAELSDNTINLYDTMMDAEEVEKKEREKTREVPKDGGWLAQTGDMLPLLGIALVAIVALVILLVAMRRRRSDEKDRTQN